MDNLHLLSYRQLCDQFMMVNNEYCRSLGNAIKNGADEQFDNCRNLLVSLMAEMKKRRESGEKWVSSVQTSRGAALGSD